MLIGLNIISCSRLTYSGFWLRYKSDQITEQKNDQGPWGGTLAINWKAKPDEQFKIAQLKKIAEKNDWKLIDSIPIKRTEIKNMTELNQPIIRVPLKNFEPNSKNADYKSQPLPRWINIDSKLYRFKTNRLIFDSRTDDSTNENGFILLSENGMEMSVYQVWGE
ncbi:hypothetical protein SAMN04487907_1176 [Zunongwangia mangrovi]|uniref:Uncharacterized protein n=1 Tax=Zunongwangia mangrovi TaxID=1334022 RepID=A0A1I1N7S8_9FLAO|nr:hypothetical protein SAMN04487907_1176 [Zunongwangia mangrovi]